MNDTIIRHANGDFHLLNEAPPRGAKTFNQWEKSYRTRFYRVRNVTVSLDAKPVVNWVSAAVVDDFGNLVLIGIEVPSFGKSK